MKGYYKNKASTKEAIVDDGWLRTGDIGHYDEDGQFFITDRLKELIKVRVINYICVVNLQLCANVIGERFPSCSCGIGGNFKRSS